MSPEEMEAAAYAEMEKVNDVYNKVAEEERKAQEPVSTAQDVLATPLLKPDQQTMGPNLDNVDFEWHPGCGKKTRMKEVFI